MPKPTSHEVASLEASTHIPEAEKLKLWVRSGGRCAFCNKYLLRDEFTAQWLNLAELAHNVGRKQSPRSARGMDPLPTEERNKAENLLLLCQDHHTLIDHGVKRDEYSPDYLRQLKRTHEERIEYLTNLDVDLETTVLRVVGDIRGAPVELSAEHVRKAVLANAGRYPRFPLAFGGQDLEIDLRGLPAEGSADYWEVGQQRIREALLYRLEEGARKGMVRHLSVFAICRLPLLVYLGYMLDDKIPTDLYQKHRSSDEGWRWDDSAESVEFSYSPVRSGANKAKIAVVLSLSAPIGIEELPDEVRDHTVYELRPQGVDPHRDVLRARSSLDNFKDCFHRLLSELEVQHKVARELHLFLAAPVSAAVVCGRSVMRDAQPAVIVYDYVGGGYAPALEINRK